MSHQGIQARTQTDVVRRMFDERLNAQSPVIGHQWEDGRAMLLGLREATLANIEQHRCAAARNERAAHQVDQEDAARGRFESFEQPAPRSFDAYGEALLDGLTWGRRILISVVLAAAAIGVSYLFPMGFAS